MDVGEVFFIILIYLCALYCFILSILHKNQKIKPGQLTGYSQRGCFCIGLGTGFAALSFLYGEPIFSVLHVLFFTYGVFCEVKAKSLWNSTVHE